MSNEPNTKRPRLPGAFCSARRGLRALDVDGAEALLALLYFKRDGVALLEFIEHNTVEVLGVEEQILRFPLAGDEAKSAVRQCLYGSGHAICFLLLVAFEKYDLLSCSPLDPPTIADNTHRVYRALHVLFIKQKHPTEAGPGGCFCRAIRHLLDGSTSQS
jgi:hypothetical protein